MHLQRIQVPDFRVLKDVDITFEKEFVPSIFPLGSQNGGGKSTLLQLIFVLLHCSFDVDNILALKNILNRFNLSENSEKRILAILEIWDKNKTVKLEFFSCRESYVRKILIQRLNREIYLNMDLPSSNKILEINNNISLQERLISRIEKSLERLEGGKRLRRNEDKNSLIENEMINLKALDLSIVNANTGIIYSLQEFQEIVRKQLELSRINLEEFYEKRRQFDFYLQKIPEYLKLDNIMYICDYLANEEKDEEVILLCKFDNLDRTEADIFFKELSQKVFLAAPATQVFLFLSQESKKLLFREQGDEKNNYSSRLKAAKSKLSGLFTYDVLAVDLLIETFKIARDRDFREAIEKGEYGNNYKELMKELNLILVNKKINLELDFSGVNFRLDRDGENRELQPEDLSHGELKRLSIYLWIKYHNIENAIVLMDEVEIAFHPDWQYQIISDLQQWAPSNQYILATHSYELCQALTPSHVKELEPKLLKQEAQSKYEP